MDGDGGRGEVSLPIVWRVLREGHPSPDALGAALRVASASGSLDAVDALVRHGAPVDAVDPDDEDFPLGNAVLNGHLGVVQRLLAAGARPTRRLRERGDDGVTRTGPTLREAAERAGFDAIAALLP